MGGAMVVTVTIASALCAAIYSFVLNPLGAPYLQTFVYILAITAIVGLLAALLKRFLPVWYQGFGAYLPLLAINSSVLGAVLLNRQVLNALMQIDFYSSDLTPAMYYSQPGRYILYSTVIGFGYALGYAVVIIIIGGIREKTAESDIPEAFRGVPITLVTLGLVALAFYAFAF
jgi:electron transport complex protein RnfA